MLKIATEREGSWSASTDVAWITLNGAREGQGPADIPFTIAANPNPANRRGTIAVNGQRAELTQAAAPAPAPSPPPADSCAVSLTPASQTVGAAAGTGSVAVTTQAGCGWTAISSAAWLTVVAGNVGFGNGTVRFQVGANSGPSRAGLIRVNDRSATVTQDAPSAPAPAPSPSPAPVEIKVDGTVSGLTGTCPNLTFVVRSMRVATSATTSFKGGGCDRLRNGNEVKVKGLQQPDGSVRATEVDRVD